MALRLGNDVVCGEILNTRNYSVHGWLALRGSDQRVLLQLTGNPSPDLAGRHIRFEARQAEEDQNQDSLDEPNTQYRGLAWQQIGPTGTMTAAHTVCAADSPAEERRRRAELGELPPAEHKPCLYLEWFSQNGRVVIELVDPIIEFVEDDEADELPLDQLPPETGAFASHDLPTSEFDELPFGNSAGDSEEAGDGALDDGLADDDAPPDDPYNLFPDGLQQALEAENDVPAWLTDDDEEVSNAIRELELMDDLIESGAGEPVGTIFEGPLTFPAPDQLADDAEAEQVLKSLLAQLALYGIALDICEHYTPRDAYRLLVEHICKEEGAYPELRHTQWVQHFMTSEFCVECEAEFEREYEERERRRREEQGDEPNGE